MTNKRPNIIAIDISGSTTTNGHYYENVRRILEQHCDDSYIIIEWNSGARRTTRQEMIQRTRNRNGSGGTHPSAILQFLQESSITDINHFILITDGQVGTNDVDMCDQVIQKSKITFQQFDGYIIGDPKLANMSVTCPFTRSCTHNIVQIEPNQHQSVVFSVSQEDLTLVQQIQTINDIDEFMKFYPAMERVFSARLIGTVGDQTLRQEVLRMQARITANIGRKHSQIQESARLMELIEAGDIDGAVALAGTFLEIQNTEYERCINTLIRMCDGGLRHVFDADSIKSFRATFAEELPEKVNVIDIDDVPTDVQTTFECPVSYEDETDPIILIARPDTPILQLIENKNNTDNVINCPLDIFHSKDPLEAMKNCIDHPISLKTMREAEQMDRPIGVSPLTRKTLIGGIPLGASEDHVNAANWTLFQLVAGGKRLGNPDMWFAVLWQMVERGMLPFLNDVLPFIREQMIFRLRHNFTSASLSGLSTFCQRQLPLAGACWFCLTSPFFITYPTKNQNMLRFHLSHASILKQMTDLVGYQFPNGFDRLYNRTIAFAAMLRFKRKDPSRYDRLIRCLYQNSIVITVNDEKHVIPIDGPATPESREQILNLLPSACRRITPEELVYLSTFIDTNKSATDNVFPVKADAPPLPKPDVNWAGIDAKYELFEKVEIDPQTMRPFKIIDGIFWKDIYKEKFGSTSNMLIGCDCAFCQFVEANMRYPTPEEYILIYAKRIFAMQKPISTLPAKILEIVKFRINAFEQAIGEAHIQNPEEVAIRFAGSSPVGMRKNFHYYFTDK